MNRPNLTLLVVVILNSACAVSLKAPPASSAQRIDAVYGSNVMRFEEFSVSSVFEKSVTLSALLLKGRAAVDARSVTFTVKRRETPFMEITCGAAPDGLKMSFGGLAMNHPKYTVSCRGPDFSLEMAGDPEKPLAGVANYRGRQYPVVTSFDTAEQGKSAHLGFVVGAGPTWLASADIQGTTWVSPTLPPDAREAVVLANFAWASRRNVVMEGASGFKLIR